MKKNYLLVLSLLFSSFIYGQTSSNSFFTKLKNKSSDKQSVQRIISSQNANRTSPLEVKQKLDSIVVEKDMGGVTEIIYKERFDYDNFGNNTSSISYEYDGTSLVLDWKELINYDANQRIIFRSTSSWSDTQNNWINEGRSNTTYQPNTIEHIYEEWDQNTSVWNKTLKEVQTENSNHQIIQQINYSWNAQSSSWTESSKLIFSYNTNNDIDTIITYAWNTLWENDSKEVYLYNSSNNNTKTIIYKWVNNTWQYKEKTNSKFDSNNMFTSVVNENYVSSNNSWEYSDSTFYSNQGDDIDFYETYDWGGIAWEKSEKDDLFHNTSYSYSDLLLPIEYQEDDEIAKYFTHMITKLDIYEEDGGNWESDMTANFFYASITINSLENNKQENLSIYPNPATDFITIANKSNKLLNIYIFDISGKKVIQQSFNSSKKVDLSKLESGVYFIQLVDEAEMIYTKKLIKY
jgi:hypothetical protein